MAAIENFVLKIKVEGQKAVDDLSKSVTNLGTTIGGFGVNAGKMTSAISGIVGGLGGLVTIAGTAATAFVGLGLKAIAMADDLSDISDATGIASGALNNFRNSLVDAGGKTEDFSTLAAKLNQNVGEAAVGNEKAQKAFQKLGVYVTDAGGAVRNTGDILRDAIAKLAAIQDPATRAAMAVDIFGKSAAKLDFTKLNAANDFAKDEQIAQLAKYQAAIDNISKSVNDSLIASAETISWKSLGYPYNGKTEALIFDVQIKKEVNEYMFNLYRKGRVLNHSVGMRYVKMFLCIDSDEAYYSSEKANWDKYYPQVMNKELADEKGFFWAVTEAKIIEGSAVVKGSNEFTPVMEIEIEKQEPTVEVTQEIEPIVQVTHEVEKQLLKELLNKF